MKLGFATRLTSAKKKKGRVSQKSDEEYADSESVEDETR